MKKIAILVAVIFAFASCENHTPLHSLYVGYVIQYGEPDKKEPITIDSNHGVEVWTWYNKGENSIRAKVEFRWKETSNTGIDWKVVQTYP